MPGLARKILVCAAVDGLIIQPLSTKGQRSFTPVQVKYSDTSITSVSRDYIPDLAAPDSYFEAFGIIGLVTVSRISYLVTITKRKQVAQVFGFPVYVVTGVAITPCTSQDDATVSIRRTVKWLNERPSSANGDSESSDEDLELPVALADEVDDDAIHDNVDNDLSTSRSSVAEDVILRKGSYGRFAQRWFSARGWTEDQRRALGLSDANNCSGPSVDSPQPGKPLPADQDTDRPATTLLPKLLRSMYLLFGKSHSFYFSYDVDITSRLSNKTSASRTDAPLHTQVDQVFFWNQHMIRAFVKAGQDGFVLPLMQGFVGQKTFIVDGSPPQVDEPRKESLELCNIAPHAPPTHPVSASARNSLDLRPSEKKYLITLISRRSTKRAGLRYLRRGIDENGFVANMVETEQILSPPGWDSSAPAYSFVQIRGSIPLFWTQTPYSLKPVPMLQHSPDENHKALMAHFESLSRNYGLVQIVNLVEKHGVEESIGRAYEKNVVRLNEEGSCGRIPFEWFDFHHACRGMKFENVSDLLSLLKDKLEGMGSTVVKDGSITSSQTGAFRTNCMDCLDRTNVCQSSFARHMLDMQLKAEGIDMGAQVDQETMWFNTLWADNGDAVSKQYASTAAMKGDYTRTRKRNYMGALNDAGLSLARLYSGMVNDYFSQAAIDFLLGNVTCNVFDEFEAGMMTKDPAVSVNRMRYRAIELCQKRVIANAEEEVHGGWVLISPNAADIVKSWPMEEVVLLLTDAALYLCRFDWDLDKVSSFERINLASVSGIKFGTYISSTVSTAQMDELKNVGFVLTYQPGKSDIKRTNTRTMSSQQDLLAAPTRVVETEDGFKRLSGLAGFFTPRPKDFTIRRFAFKATYADSSTIAKKGDPKQTEIEHVVTICTEIERLVLDRQLKEQEQGSEQKSIIEKCDIISLDSAKRDTGLFEQLGHSIKKLVWA